ncbi:MAG TPA: hypothetical protein VLW53_16070 [Candidatus Eisenbacteria bacterium]|nr:hypothetical protein [Candidatus Eisenbacteria bacterium]
MLIGGRVLQLEIPRRARRAALAVALAAVALRAAKLIWLGI